MTMPPSKLLVVWALGAALMSGASPGHAAPATDSTTPAPDSEVQTPAISVSAARGVLERGMAELGELAARARQSGDATRLACVQDKQDRAGAVMEVATGDVLALQDPASDAQTRAFAGEKLSESAQQMQGLVAQARACQGRDEAMNGQGSNEARIPQSVIPQDPTGPGAPAARGLPPIDPRPPVASPVL